MKREDLFKFAMTAVCAAVLSACGSSGGDSKPSTGSTSTINKPDMTKPGETKPGETKPGETKPGETKPGETKPGETKPGETKPGEAKPQEGNKGATDDKPLTMKPDNSRPNSNVGFKHVNKQDSNFVINTSKTDSNPKGTVGRTGSDVPAAMDVQAPFPSLDTFIIAEPGAGAAPRGYLEDFDFRKAGKEAATTQDKGEFTLTNIYVEDGNLSTKERLAQTSKTASDPVKRAETPTKTDTHGMKEGKVFLYETDRLDYTNNYKGKVFKAQDKTFVQTERKDKYAPRHDAKEGDKLFGSIAEVYGYRTFANDSDEAIGDETHVFTDADVNNLPLAHTLKDDKGNALELENKGRLKNVQYGRVTSSLSGHGKDDYKKGIDLGQIDTFVVSYGKFGDNKTENHYFYRGINNISKADLAALKAQVGKGLLTYHGHAVSYGLDNNYFSRTDLNAPTAIVSQQSGLVSGNHVEATVNLADKEVDGSIYNKWYHSAAKGLVDSTLVRFKGTIAENGNIAGEAENDKTKEKGVFGASLFGKQAEELGGVVASYDKGEKRWGAVFGAVRATLPKAPEKEQPKEEVKEEALSNSTNNAVRSGE